MRKTSSKILCSVISAAMVLSSMTVDVRAEELAEDIAIVEFEDTDVEDVSAEDSEIVEFEENIDEESLEDEVVIVELEDEAVEEEFEDSEEIVEFEEEPVIEEIVDDSEDEAIFEDEEVEDEDGDVEGELKWDYNPSTKVITVSATVSGKEVTYVDIPEYIGSTPKTNGSTGFMDAATKIVIDKKIAKIGDSAFSKATGWDKNSIASVEIDTTVTSIGKSAFDGQAGLATLTFKDAENSLLTSIGDNAFRGTIVSNLTVPKRVTTIGKHAFDGDDALVDVTFAAPSSLKTIGDYAFRGCDNSSFLTISIPDSVTTIGNSAFEDCAELRTVSFSNLNSKLTKIGQRAFAGCSTLSTIYIPSSMAGKTIGEEAFEGCTSLNKIGDDSLLVDIKVGAGVITSDSFYKNFDNLTDIFTPNTLTSITPNALTVNTRSSLQRVELTAVTSIADATFKNCFNLVSVTCPQTLKIGKEAFSGCTQLDGVSIPKVETIGDKAFYGCADLTSIESKVKVIGKSVFEGCSDLETVVINQCTKIDDKAFKDCIDLSTINIANVTYIGTSTFENCESLTSADEAHQIIPSKVTYIGSYAFKGCNGADFNYIIIPNTITDILVSTFEGDDNLAVVKIEGGVKNIGSRAFADCDGIGNSAPGSSLYLPLTIESIHNNAFMGCTGLESLGPVSSTTHYDIQYTYPEVVPGNLFCKFYDLTSVTVPNSRGVTEIGDAAFARCYNLTDVYLTDTVTEENSLKVIGKNAFRFCRSLAKITVPMGVKTIGDYAFASCPKLGYIDMANSVKTIGAYAFADDVKLGTTETDGTTPLGDPTDATVEMPEALETIGSYAFSGCEGLYYMIIPMGVKTIKEGAFMSCRDRDADITAPYNPTTAKGLMGVLISPTVANLGANIFADCKDDLEIIGYRGVNSDSIVYKYALANGIKFRTNTISYNIAFEGNGSTGGAGMATIMGCQSDEEIQLPANTFTNTTKVFVGWNTRPDGTGVTYADKAVVLNPTIDDAATVTLYAMWETPYEINYILNGGTNSTKNPTKYTAASATITLADPTIAGTYAFAGWYSDASCTTTKVTKIEKGTKGNITLYAKWSYKVTFNGNGATSGTMATQKLYRPISTALTANAFKRTGYTFVNWNTKRDGSGKAYTNKQKLSNTGTTGNITLYAQWKPISYTIAFNANGGKGSMSKLTSRKYGKTVTLPKSTFTRKGYTFLGWSTSKTAKKATYSNKSKVKNLTSKNGATVTLYAVWKKN